jgi:hypothetical protein
MPLDEQQRTEGRRTLQRWEADYYRCCPSDGGDYVDADEAEKRIEEVERERDALILVVRRLMAKLPDSRANGKKSCVRWCWDELNGDAQDEVQAVRAEATTLLAEIERRA